MQLAAMPGLPSGWRRAGAAAAYAACVWTLLEGLLLPLRFFQGYVLERRYAQSSIGVVRWTAAHAATLGLGAVLVAAAAVVISMSQAMWPAGWWLVCGATFAGGLILLTNLAPVCVIPMLYTVRPLTRLGLRERFAALAQRAGVPAPRVEECDTGGTTTRAQATLVGLGPTRRILLSETLLADYSDEEIEVVLAHELGHHVHRDVWWLMGFELSVALMGLVAGGWAVGRLGGLFGVAGLADIAGLPLLALAAGGVMVAAAPFGYALSRWHERRADHFALRVTGNSAAFNSGLRRLGAQHLAEERPSRLVELLCYSHPPLHRRLAVSPVSQRSRVTPRGLAVREAGWADGKTHTFEPERPARLSYRRR